MNKQEKELLVNKLLCFVLDELEDSGKNYHGVWYNFFPAEYKEYLTSDGVVKEPDEREHCFKVFQDINGVDDEQMKTVLNYCLAHKLFERSTLGVEEFQNLMLTPKGYTHAVNIEKAKTYQPASSQQQNISINTLNAANVQVGNNNTQNISNFKEVILHEIDKSDATPEEKEEAKTLLDTFLANPIISGIISNLPTAVVAGLMLGG